MCLRDKGNKCTPDAVASNLNGTLTQQAADLDDFVVLVHSHLHGRGLVHLHAFERQTEPAVTAMGPIRLVAQGDLRQSIEALASAENAGAAESGL